jgi:hypothetical protein
LRISADLDNPDDGDHEATWLLGHTERLSFHRVWRHEEDLFARATLHVPCRYLEEGPEGTRCRAWDLQGHVPPPPRRHQRRQLPGDRFRIVDHGRFVTRKLPRPVLSPRQLAVLEHNPCATAPCRTSDLKVGAACCRDLQIEIMCDEGWTAMELLVRSRKPPYLCKVVREREDSIEGELISACGYLGADGVACTLHGRTRPDGRSAKPDLCHRWPKPTRDEVLHAGCVFARPA